MYDKASTVPNIITNITNIIIVHSFIMITYFLILISINFTLTCQGANYNIALHHAKTNHKKYFAIARGGEDGHAFAFSAIDNSRGTMQGGGCERPCLDLQNKVCGCIDSACTGPIPKGEEHNRRWAVYEVISGRK